MSQIRARVSFALLRSALLHLRSLRVSRSVNLELSDIDLDTEKGQATDNAILFSSFLVILFTLENSFFFKKIRNEFRVLIEMKCFFLIRVYNV